MKRTRRIFTMLYCHGDATIDEINKILGTEIKQQSIEEVKAAIESWVYAKVSKRNKDTDSKEFYRAIDSKMMRLTNDQIREALE